MPLDTWATIVSIAVGIMAILGSGGLVGIWRLLNATQARNRAIDDALLGTPATLDKSGAEITPGQPGLAARATRTEEAVVEMRHTIALLTEALGRLDHHEHRLKALEDDKTALLITKAESAQMWRAIAEAKPETGAEAIPGATDPEPPEETL